MAGARGVARNSKPPRPPGNGEQRRLSAGDLAALEQLAKIDAALAEATEAAVKSKDVPTLLKLHAHWTDQRSRPEPPHDASSPDPARREGDERAGVVAAFFPSGGDPEP